ncbi:MAG TPA: TIGR02147 family protein [Fibrobacteria bacterium]|nr:TIGR02147 family protein [Fibrobacteria bacterium]
MDAQPTPAPEPAAPNIYRYDDFRVFLKEMFRFRKDRDKAYSYRKFAKDAGIANPGFLLDVIVGKRTLSGNAAKKTAAAFGLNEAEAEFFRLLADFGQSKKDGERQEIYREILYRRNRSRFARLSPSLVKYYQDFHYPLVYSALHAFDFRGDYEGFGGVFDPAIAPGSLKKYIRDLCEWELVKQGPDGRYTVTEAFVEPPGTMGALVRRLNREWILQAAESLFRHGPEERHVSTLLLSVSEETRKLLRDQVERFRRQVLDLVAQDKGTPSGLMQLSLQYFPKTKKRK